MDANAWTPPYWRSNLGGCPGNFGVLNCVRLCMSYVIGQCKIIFSKKALNSDTNSYSCTCSVERM